MNKKQNTVQNLIIQNEPQQINNSMCDLYKKYTNKRENNNARTTNVKQCKTWDNPKQQNFQMSQTY